MADPVSEEYNVCVGWSGEAVTGGLSLQKHVRKDDGGNRVERRESLLWLFLRGKTSWERGGRC